MANMQLNCLLCCVCVLLTQLTIRATAQCEDRVRNVAIYEGTLSTLINYCPGTPKGVKWSILATTNESAAVDIVNYNDAVSQTYAADYEFSPSGLTIRNATTRATPPDHQLSTAGLYTVESGGNQSLFKVLVVHSGPVCSCLQGKYSSDTQLSCTVTYADSSTNPIFPVMTWMVNGAEHSNDEPHRSKTDQYVFTATSTITVNRKIVKNYQCVLNFGQPMFVKKVSMATNAPEFSELCSAAECTAENDEQVTIADTNPNKTNAATITPSITPTSIKTTSHCILNMRNIVVREGTLNVPIPVAASPCAVSWLILPTTNELEKRLILAPNCTRDSTLANLFTVNGSGLIIRTSTTTENGNPMSTSGLYVAQCNDNRNKSGAKLIVLRNGPECSCVPNGSSSTVKLSCRAAFAETTIHPIPAIFTWIVNGKIYDVVQPRKDKLDMLVFTAISTITVDGSTVRDYQCILSFGQPTDLSKYTYIATNAPEFKESCTTPVCSIKRNQTVTTAPATQSTNAVPTPPKPLPHYCFPNMRNLAVREGKFDMRMNVSASPCNVVWLAFQTTNELGPTTITHPNCTFDPSLEGLYYANTSGLLIRKSTTSESGQTVSTSGIYIAECIHNGNKTGAKLVVVRSGPDCSCVPDNSSSNVTLSCTVDFADHSVNPIPAIMTWMSSGKHYSTDQPYTNRTDLLVYTATSTITVDRSTVKDNKYQCILTFGQPTDIQYDFIATNAPEFKESCSMPVCGNLRNGKS